MRKTVTLEQIREPLQQLGAWLDETIPPGDSGYRSMHSIDAPCRSAATGCWKRAYNLGGVALSVMSDTYGTEPGTAVEQNRISLAVTEHRGDCQGLAVATVKQASGIAERVDQTVVKGSITVHELAVRRTLGPQALWLYDSCVSQELWCPGEAVERTGTGYSNDAPFTDVAGVEAQFARMRQLVRESFPAAD